ncbi:hypothetical protein [Micromonospora sp. NPDC049102]|uniref:hypothetical protein n=1 Tax=Micromonospora sp. NPDC049102 TaxID=3364265 RepID=UPI003717BB41
MPIIGIPPAVRAGVDHRGQAGVGEGVQDRVVVAGGPHDEAVHGRLRDALGVGARAGDRDQGESDTLGGAHVGDPCEKARRLWIVEGVVCRAGNSLNNCRIGGWRAEVGRWPR